MPHMGAYVELEAQQTRQLLGRAQQQVMTTLAFSITFFAAIRMEIFVFSHFHASLSSQNVIGTILSSHVEIKSSCSGTLRVYCNCIVLYFSVSILTIHPSFHTYRGFVPSPHPRLRPGAQEDWVPKAMSDARECLDTATHLFNYVKASMPACCQLRHVPQMRGDHIYQ